MYHFYKVVVGGGGMGGDLSMKDIRLTQHYKCIYFLKKVYILYAACQSFYENYLRG